MLPTGVSDAVVAGWLKSRHLHEPLSPAAAAAAAAAAAVFHHIHRCLMLLWLPLRSLSR
jgi:sugar/nucleoside kinase (ribokinase family)